MGYGVFTRPTTIQSFDGTTQGSNPQDVWIDDRSKDGGLDRLMEVMS
jgi:hypothetical protein